MAKKTNKKPAKTAKKAKVVYDCGGRKGLVKKPTTGCAPVEDRGFREGLRKVGKKKAKKKAGAKTFKENPSDREGMKKAIVKARELYRDFHGEEPESIERITVPDWPKELIVIGPLLVIGYRARRDGEKKQYLHEFAAKSRPLLCCTPDGKQLVIVGGNYTFTDRGITDR